MWMTLKWLQKQNMAPMWKKVMKNLWYWRTDIISWPCVSTWMQTKWKDYWTIFTKLWITEQLKNYRDRKNARTNSSVVLWHGRTCSKMRWAILWTGKQESGATLQSFKSWPGWPSIQAGGTRISWRIVRSLHTNCHEMRVFGTNWATWHFVAGQQACKISHKNWLWHVTDGSQDWFLTFITQVTTDNVVMRVTWLSIVDWVDSKTQILLETSASTSGESHVFSEVEHLFP